MDNKIESLLKSMQVDVVCVSELGQELCNQRLKINSLEELVEELENKLALK